MEVGTLPIQLIFEKDILHRVPLFQRPYVWTKEQQWSLLWADLKRLAETLARGETPRAHFMGASVQGKPKVPPGHIETRELIDGQQRLTTLQVVLQAFQDIAAERGVENYRLALRKMTRNEHPLSTAAHERFKVWPTNVDRDDFRATMEAGSPAALRKTFGKGSGTVAVGRPIPDAYLFFHDAIGSWLSADEADGERIATRIAALYSALRENVRLVVIDLDERDDAQVIFETLNARGTPLLAADLVKNALLQEALVKKLDVEDLYRRYWAPIDAEAGYWRALLGRGHAQRPRIEFFLQFFLTTQTKKEVSTAHLYADYQDHASTEAAGTVEERLKTLYRYSEIYSRVERWEAPPRARLALSRLDRMDVGTAYPFLLELFARIETDGPRLTAVLEDLESFLVRRMVCRLSTRGYGAFFIDLLGALEGDDAGIPERVRAQLMEGTAEVDRWPNDAEFREAWLDTPLYSVITRPRLRMLLEMLERAMRSQLSEIADVPANLTVEHVMPQAWETHWPLPPEMAPDAATVARHRLIHTIGNLTLLNEKLNPLVSNGPWDDGSGGGKRSALKDHSVLHLNKRLSDRESWTDAAIRARSQELFELATRIWPRHGAVVAVAAG